MRFISDYASNIKALSKPARLYLYSTVLYSVGLTLVQLYLNFYLQSAGLDQGWIGLVNAAPQLTVVACTLFIGVLSARLGPWRASIIGAVLAGLGIVGIAAFPSAWMILAASVLNGIGDAFLWSNSGPFMMLHSQEKTRSILFSVQAALGTLIGFFAYLLGGQLPGIFASVLGSPPDAVLVMQVILGFASLFYLASIVPIYLAGRNVAPKVPGAAEVVVSTAPRPKRRIPISDPGLYLRLILPGSLMGLGAGMTIPFINLYINFKFGVNFDGLGQLFAWTSIATAVALMVQPLLADRFGKVKSVVLVQGASLPFLLLLGYSAYFPLVAVALFVRGALMNMGNPIFSAYSMERVPERERATFSSMSASTWSLGWAGGSWFSGSIRDALGAMTGFNVLFALMAILYASSMVMMWIWFVREETARRSSARPESRPVKI